VELAAPFETGPGPTDAGSAEVAPGARILRGEIDEDALRDAGEIVRAMAGTVAQAERLVFMAEKSDGLHPPRRASTRNTGDG
jgi:hypothetical protein